MVFPVNVRVVHLVTVAALLTHQHALSLCIQAPIMQVNAPYLDSVDKLWELPRSIVSAFTLCWRSPA